MTGRGASADDARYFPEIARTGIGKFVADIGDHLDRAGAGIASLRDPKKSFRAPFAELCERWAIFRTDHEVVGSTVFYRNDFAPTVDDLDFGRTAEKRGVFVFSWCYRDPHTGRSSDDVSIAEIPIAFFADPGKWEREAVSSGNYRNLRADRESAAAEAAETERGDVARAVERARALLTEQGFTITEQTEAHP